MCITDILCMEILMYIMLTPLMLSAAMSFMLYVKFFHQDDFSQNFKHRIIFLQDENNENDLHSANMINVASTKPHVSTVPDMERQALTYQDEESFNKIMKQLDPYD